VFDGSHDATTVVTVALCIELSLRITDEHRNEWSTLDPVQWASESYRLALSNAYAIPNDGELGQDYFERNIPVVEQRLAMAGVRLAAVLNAIFGETKELPF